MYPIDTNSPFSCATILVNWNGWEDTIECIDTLIGAYGNRVHIIVVDNDSSDNSVNHLRDWLDAPKAAKHWKSLNGVRHYSLTDNNPPVKYSFHSNYSNAITINPETTVTIIQSGSNLGFAGGNNIGLRVANNSGIQWFWLLNTDTVITPDTLPELIRRTESDTRYGIVGSTLAYYSSPQQIQAMGGATLNRCNTAMAHIGQDQPITSVPEDPSAIEAQMAYVVGASMLVSRRFLETVGYMQEDYFLYFEEIDWACRGIPPFKLGYAPKSIVYHKVGGSSSKVVSAFSLNLLYRNRIRFVSRFLPDRLASTRWALRKELIRHLLKARWMPAKLVARTLRDFNALVASAAPTQE